MPVYPYNTIPWCTGRIYPNAWAEMNQQSVTRRPPYFWLINAAGFVGAPCALNTEVVLRPFQTPEGKNTSPQWVWYHADETMVSYTYKLFWRRRADGDREWFLQVTPCGSGIHFQEWRSAPFQVVFNWRSFDGLVFADKVSQSVGWPYGSPGFQLRVGEYSRLPAHSCRGDYNGEWP